MKHRISTTRTSNWIKPLLTVAVSAALTAGCNATMQTSGGVGQPPSMPSPSGGMPPPPSGSSGSPSSSSSSKSGQGSQSGQSGPQSSQSGSQSGQAGSQSGQSGSQSGGSSGMPGGMPPMGGEGGSQGSQPGGQSGTTSAGQGGAAGGVGEIPPPPSQQGGGGESGGAEGGSPGESGEDNPFADADSEGSGECGDTGAMPGGIGGMGQAGECLESGGGSASSDASSSASGGGAAGGGEAGSEASSAGGTGGAGSMGEFPSESDAERAARLGRELDESIGGFDEALQEEQRAIASTGRVAEGFDLGDGEGGGSGGLISLGSQSAGSNSEAGMVGGAAPMPDEESAISGMSQEEIAERTPEDIPTMVDDDIIARQLREAALVEEDPQLRERLWNEYRKYKGVPVVD